MSAPAAGQIVTLPGHPDDSDLCELSAAVATLVHDSPDVVVDLTRLTDLPRPVATLLLRLDALARGAGGQLRARFPTGRHGGDVIELDVECLQLLDELGGPLASAAEEFGNVAALAGRPPTRRS